MKSGFPSVPRVDVARQLGRGRRTESTGQVLADRGRRQRSERDLLGEPVQDELPREPEERVVGRAQLGWAITGDQQEPGGFSPPGQEGDRLEGRRVGPVQVLEPDDQLTLLGQGLQERRQLAEHAAGRRRSPSPGVRLALGGIEEGACLPQPGRRPAPHRLGHGPAALAAPEAFERLDQREIRIPATILLHALAEADPRRSGL
jgi:hypothetical protein